MSNIYSIIRGNDFSLCIQASKIIDEEPTPVSFADFTDLQVRLTKVYSNEKLVVPFEVNNDGDIIVTISGLPSTTYGIEVIGVCNDKNWRWAKNSVFRIVETEESSNVTDSETVEADEYNVTISVGESALTRADMEAYISELLAIRNVNVQIDGDFGNPTGDGTFDGSTLNLNLHNIRGRQGKQGTSAIWDGDAEVLTQLEQTFGEHDNRTISQKFITSYLEGDEEETYTEYNDVVQSKYADTSGEYVIYRPTPTIIGNTAYVMIPCSAGDEFIISGKSVSGENGLRLYAFGYEVEDAINTGTAGEQHPELIYYQKAEMGLDTRDEPLTIYAPEHIEDDYNYENETPISWLVVNFTDYDSEYDYVKKVEHTQVSEGLAPKVQENTYKIDELFQILRDAGIITD